MWFEELLISIKSSLVLLAPEMIRPVVSALLSSMPILMSFGGLFAMVTLLERKMLGRIQNRLGPNRVGPFGLFQPVADGIKMLTKEDIVPQCRPPDPFPCAPDPARICHAGAVGDSLRPKTRCS